MKLMIFLIGSILFSLNQTVAQGTKFIPPVSPRVEKIINTNWVFNYFPEKDPPAFEKSSFDDSRWPVIALPHTWQTFETTRELHPYIRNASSGDDPYWWNGWGCYRKHLVIGKQFWGKKVYFEFEGVQKYAKVFLNGKFLGEHKGGYTGFYVDATHAVNFGGDNVLAVAVNNSLNDQYHIPPMSAGNFDVYGGIHRDVRLVIKEPVNIPFQGSWEHEGGTFITTPVANDSVAVVQVKTWIRNNGNSPRNVRLVTTLTHTFGLIIEKIETEKRIMPGETALFTQHSQPMKSPRLWSPDRPYFYNAFSEVYVENRLSDFFHTLFGIRYFHWDYDQHRLVLNGKPIQLHGINRHEEYVWLGAAFPDWIAERDMDDIRFGLEANFMRTAHYPQDPSIYSYTDTRGICINEELPNIKKLPFNDTIQERNCREMIRRDRNHPSILFWSMGNETDDACDSRIAVQEDTTRILTVRQPYNLSYNPEFVKHTDKEMPLESFLRCTIKGWYDRDDRNLEPEDNQWAGTEEWQHTQSAKSTISEHNGAVWLYADHGADREYTNAPLKHVNPKGWVDSWRNPKYAYYQWQANFAKTPMVFIHPHFWRKQYLGQKKDFVVDSNAGKVELWKNGKSLGVLKPDKSNNFCVTFREVEVEEGYLEAIIETASGDKIRHRLDMAGDPYALKIDHFNIIMESTPDHVNELNIDIVDKNGIHVTGASNTLKFKVEGPATLVGPEVYVSDRDKKEAWEGTMYIDAPVTSLIRATGKTGKVRFTASSPGLLPASCEIEVVPWVDPCPVNGITEPPLNPEGRLPVRVNPGMANFTKVPEEMKNHPGEIRFPADQKEQFPDLVKQFVLRENPNLRGDTPDLKVFTGSVVSILESTIRYSGTEGYVVADDYNFLVRQYNLSRAITSAVEKKKLPEAFRKELAEYYSGEIIRNGNDKNVQSEIDLIAKIPDGGKAFVCGTGNNLSGVEQIKETDLKDLIISVYPGFRNQNRETWKKALALTELINPYIEHQRIRNRETKEYTDVYTLLPGKVILLPDESVLLNARPPERKL